MPNTFEQISEILERLEILCGSEHSMPAIEKDIVLEKLRNIYAELQRLPMASDAPVQETPMPEKGETEVPAPAKEEVPAESAQNEQPEYAVYQGMEEDVDLFFDTEHESYKSVAKDPEPEPKPEPEPEPDPDPIPVPTPEPVEEPAPVREVEPVAKPVPTPEPTPSAPDHVPTSRPRRDDQIEPENLFSEDEDDLLQFIPQPKAVKQPKATVTSPKSPVKSAEPVQRSLNDLFNERREDHSLSAQFQNAKVHDLTKAISINEKFTYIKELFQNRGEEFSAAIQKLNQCANLEDAFDCLEEYKKNYFWDTTSTAYLSLCDLLRRKYS